MGCCISTCRPEKPSIDESNCNHVQDKLVISQRAPNIPQTPLPLSNKISPAPPSPTNSSTSSISSFTCTNGSGNISNTPSSCSSLTSSISTGSSILANSKDQRFSNEFLWSCIKENPHVIRINSIRERSQLLVPPQSTVRAQKLDSPSRKISAHAASQPSHQQSAINRSNTLQRRVPSSSPAPSSITRQKSFRREEPDQGPNFFYNSLPTRSLRSPSPSRRFNGDISSRSSRGIYSTIMSKENYSRCMASPKINAAPNNNYNNFVSSSTKKENYLRPASPCTVNSSHNVLRPGLKNRSETCIHRISSKIDEIAVQQALDHHDSEWVPMEDIDNPLISLDCFIFL